MPAAKTLPQRSDPHLVAAFATVLGIPADYLAALGGVELPDTVSPPYRAVRHRPR